MTDQNDDITFIHGTPVERDWDWWSSFLQREYYGTPEELPGWVTTAGSIARTVRLEPDERVVDLGSGCGELAIHLALRGAVVTGVEMSAQLVEYCQQTSVTRGVNVRFVVADLYEWEPEDGAVDVVLSVNTSLGYGTDAQNRDVIRRIAGWLRPGGRFYFDTVSADAAEAFGAWSDDVAGGRLVVDNAYDPVAQVMTTWPTWVSPTGEIITADRAEVVRLYTRADVEAMMTEAGLTPRRLAQAMGRRVRQDDDQMLTTWVATKEER